MGHARPWFRSRDQIGWPVEPGSARRLAGLAALVLGLLPGPRGALAGPPFTTDDPVPVEMGHWEVYGFTDRQDTDEDRSGNLAGIEVNYGVARDVQLHVIAPVAFDAPRQGPFRAGPGDVELGVKYRFAEGGRGLLRPQIAIFPLLEVPTGSAARGLGGGALSAFLPIWLQEDFGPWTTYGGGGYWINPGEGNQNYWFVGWLIQRRITEKLSAGGELFYQTSDEVGGRDATGFNVGLTYDVTEHYRILLSAGRGVQNVGANRLSYYAGLQYTF